MGEPINHVIKELNNELKEDEIKKKNDEELHKKITALLLAGQNNKALKLIDPSLPSPSITPPLSNEISENDTEDSTCRLTLFGFSITCVSNKTRKKRSTPKKKVKK